MANSAHGLRVLYDADCGFCRWSLAKLLAWDRRGRLTPVAIQSAEGAQLLADLSIEQRLGSWHLIDADGRRHSGGAGLPLLLRELPGGGPLAAVLVRFPGVTDRGYRWVAGRRTLLGKPIGGAARRRARARINQRAD